MMPSFETSMPPCILRSVLFFFFNDTATTEIYTLSLHYALPISSLVGACRPCPPGDPAAGVGIQRKTRIDRKSTRLNSSHVANSYADSCLKKKKECCRISSNRSFWGVWLSYCDLAIS